MLPPYRSNTTTTTMTSSSLSSLSSIIPDTMKCIIYGPESGIVQEVIRSTDKIRQLIQRHQRSKHDDDMVVVKVYAVGLNPVDAKDVMGDKIPRSCPMIRRYARHYYVQNNVIGFEFSGIVVSTTRTPSSSTTKDDHDDQSTLKLSGRYQIGDYVFGTVPPFHGTLAEYIMVPYHQLCHMPLYYYNDDNNNDQNQHDNDMKKTSSTTASPTRYPLHFTQAAAMPLVYLTIYQCLHEYINRHHDTLRSICIIGGSGGTGHIAIMMAKYIWHIPHITAICSKRNQSFCQQLGATHIIPYDDDENDNHDNDMPSMIRRMIQSDNGIPYDIIMDCVTSDDPRDHNFSYPVMIQQYKNDILTPDYIYRRLGGPTMDWFRAGIERITPISLWSNRHEKLFWIQFPYSDQQLYQLYQWMMMMTTSISPNDRSESKDDLTKSNDKPVFLKPPVIDHIYPFTKEGVENAFGALLSRRVRGKVVIEVIPSSSESTSSSVTIS